MYLALFRKNLITKRKMEYFMAITTTIAIKGAFVLAAAAGITTNKKMTKIPASAIKTTKDAACRQKENLTLYAYRVPKEQRKIIHRLAEQTRSLEQQKQALDPSIFNLERIGSQNTESLMLNPNPENLRERIVTPGKSFLYTAKRAFYPAYTPDKLDLLPNQRLDHKKVSFVAKALNKNNCFVPADKIKLASSSKTKISFKNLAVLLEGNYTVQGWGHDSKVIFENMVIEVGADITDEESAEQALSYENICNALYKEITNYHQENEKTINENLQRARFLKNEARTYATVSPELKQYLRQTNCPSRLLKSTQSDPLDLRYGTATTARCGLYELFDQITEIQKK